MMPLMRMLMHIVIQPYMEKAPETGALSTFLVFPFFLIFILALAFSFPLAIAR